MVWVDDLRPVETLLERVKYEERSLYRAVALGNDALFGWGNEAYLLAGVVNGVNTQVKGKRLTASQRVNPPQPVKKKKKERVGVDMRQPVEKMDLSRMVPAKYRR